MRVGTVRQNVLWALLGNTVYAGSQWAILIVLAKYLTADSVGQFALALAVSAPVFGFTNLQLRAIQATDVRDTWSSQNYLGLRLLSSACAVVVITAIVWTNEYGADASRVILVIAAAKAIESISDIFYGQLQKHEDLKSVAQSLILKALIGLLIVAIAVITTRSVVPAAVALTSAWALVLIAYDYRKAQLATKEAERGSGLLASFEFAKALQLARTALPMGVLICLNSLTQNIPRYVIADTHGESGVGYYSAIAYVMIAISVIVSAMGQAIAPRMARYFSDNRVEYKKMLYRALASTAVVGGAGIAAAILFGREILAFIYTTEYSVHYGVFVWTMVGAALFGLVSILGVAITAALRYKSQAVVAVGMVGITYFACALLVPRFGLEGGAVAVVISLVFKLLVQGLQIFYLFRTAELR